MKAVGSLKSDWLKENEHIIGGLRDLTSLFPDNKYRVFGSLVSAALAGPYRRIGDIDVVADGQVRERVIEGFGNRGYKVGPVRGFGNLVGATPLRFSKGETQIDIFFGRVEKEGGWRLPLLAGFSLYAPPSAWKAHQFEFGGVKFLGITPSTAYYGISLIERNRAPFSKGRPKDLETLEKHANPREVEKIKRQNPGLWFGNTYIPADRFIATLGTTFQVLEERLGICRTAR